MAKITDFFKAARKVPVEKPKAAEEFEKSKEAATSMSTAFVEAAVTEIEQHQNDVEIMTSAHGTAPSEVAVPVDPLSRPCVRREEEDDEEEEIKAQVQEAKDDDADREIEEGEKFQEETVVSPQEDDSINLLPDMQDHEQKIDHTVPKICTDTLPLPTDEIENRDGVLDTTAVHERDQEEEIDATNDPVAGFENDTDDPEIVEPPQRIDSEEEEADGETGGSEMYLDPVLSDRQSAGKTDDESQEEDELLTSSPDHCPDTAIEQPSSDHHNSASDERVLSPIPIQPAFDSKEHSPANDTTLVDEEGHDYRLSLGYDPIALELVEGPFDEALSKDAAKEGMPACKSPLEKPEEKATSPLVVDPWHFSPIKGFQSPSPPKNRSARVTTESTDTLAEESSSGNSYQTPTISTEMKKRASTLQAAPRRPLTRSASLQKRMEMTESPTPGPSSLPEVRDSLVSSQAMPAERRVGTSFIRPPAPLRYVSSTSLSQATPSPRSEDDGTETEPAELIQADKPSLAGELQHCVLEHQAQQTISPRTSPPRKGLLPSSTSLPSPTLPASSIASNDADVATGDFIGADKLEKFEKEKHDLFRPSSDELEAERHIRERREKENDNALWSHFPSDDIPNPSPKSHGQDSKDLPRTISSSFVPNPPRQPSPITTTRNRQSVKPGFQYSQSMLGEEQGQETGETSTGVHERQVQRQMLAANPLPRRQDAASESSTSMSRRLSYQGDNAIMKRFLSDQSNSTFAPLDETSAESMSAVATTSGPSMFPAASASNLSNLPVEGTSPDYTQEPRREPLDVRGNRASFAAASLPSSQPVVRRSSRRGAPKTGRSAMLATGTESRFYDSDESLASTPDTESHRGPSRIETSRPKDILNRRLPRSAIRSRAELTIMQQGQRRTADTAISARGVTLAALEAGSIPRLPVQHFRTSDVRLARRHVSPNFAVTQDVPTGLDTRLVSETMMSTPASSDIREIAQMLMKLRNEESRPEPPAPAVSVSTMKTLSPQRQARKSSMKRRPVEDSEAPPTKRVRIVDPPLRSSTDIPRQQSDDSLSMQSSKTTYEMTCPSYQPGGHQTHAFGTCDVRAPQRLARTQSMPSNVMPFRLREEQPPWLNSKSSSEASTPEDEEEAEEEEAQDEDKDQGQDENEDEDEIQSRSDPCSTSSTSSKSIENLRDDYIYKPGKHAGFTSLAESAARRPVTRGVAKTAFEAKATRSMSIMPTVRRKTVSPHRTRSGKAEAKSSIADLIELHQKGARQASERDKLAEAALTSRRKKAMFSLDMPELMPSRVPRPGTHGSNQARTSAFGARRRTGVYSHGLQSAPEASRSTLTKFQSRPPSSSSSVNDTTLHSFRGVQSGPLAIRKTPARQDTPASDAGSESRYSNEDTKHPPEFLSRIFAIEHRPAQGHTRGKKPVKPGRNDMASLLSPDTAASAVQKQAQPATKVRKSAETARPIILTATPSSRKRKAVPKEEDELDPSSEDDDAPKFEEVRPTKKAKVGKESAQSRKRSVAPPKLPAEAVTAPSKQLTAKKTATRPSGPKQTAPAKALVKAELDIKPVKRSRSQRSPVGGGFKDLQARTAAVSTKPVRPMKIPAKKKATKARREPPIEVAELDGSADSPDEAEAGESSFVIEPRTSAKKTKAPAVKKVDKAVAKPAKAPRKPATKVTGKPLKLAPMQNHEARIVKKRK